MNAIFSPMPLSKLSGRRLRLFVLVVTALLGAAPAWAVDGAGFVERLRELGEPRGLSIAYGSIEDTAENAFVIRDMELTRESKPDEVVRVHQVTVAGAKDLGDDGVAMDELSVSGVSFSGQTEKGEEIVVTLDNLIASGVYFPDSADADAPL